MVRLGHRQHERECTNVTSDTGTTPMREAKDRRASDLQSVTGHDGNGAAENRPAPGGVGRDLTRLHKSYNFVLRHWGSAAYILC